MQNNPHPEIATNRRTFFNYLIVAAGPETATARLFLMPIFMQGICANCIQTVFSTRFVARAARLRRHSHPAEYLPTQSKWPGLRWIWKHGTRNCGCNRLERRALPRSRSKGRFFVCGKIAALRWRTSWTGSVQPVLRMQTAGIRRTALPSLQAAGSLRSRRPRAADLEQQR